MTYENETLSVAIYLYNKWQIIEAKELFGEWMGEHIYNKWCDYDKDMLKFVCELDKESLDKLIARACSLYNGRNNR